MRGASRVMAAVVCLAPVLCLAPAVPLAAEGAATDVAVLPFSSADEELSIYGKPVADMVAEKLRSDELKATSLAPDTTPPRTTDLVVQLRVTRQKRKLRLEAIVRDPGVGDTLVAVSAKPVTLDKLDRAAVELARKLRPKLGTAAAARLARIEAEDIPKDPEPEASPPTPTPAPTRNPDPNANPYADPTTATSPSTSPSTSTSTSTSTVEVDARRPMAVSLPDGEVVGGAVPFQSIASAALHNLVTSLGFRPVSTGRLGIAPTPLAAEDARRLGAPAILMLRVKSITFEPRGVLTARGTVRLKAVSADGQVLLDRVVSTDTLVGSRGDKQDALVRFVLRQAMDMVTRDLKKALP